MSAQKAVAKLLWETSHNLSARQIADKVGVQKHVLTGWAHRGGWVTDTFKRYLLDRTLKQRQDESRLRCGDPKLNEARGRQQ